VNGSNARFYDLTLAQSKTLKSGNINISKTTMPVFAIATDDGYLMNAVSTPNIVIGPGERYEIIIDFGGLAGTEWIMMNSARTPFPGGGKVVQNLTDQVMQFRVNQPLSGVVDTAVIAGSPLRDPATNPIHDIKVGLTPMPPPPATVPVPPAPLATIVRQLTLNEVIGAGGPLELVVNNSKLNLADILPSCNTTACRETEMPAVGDTEIWEIINITADAHPMHTHLTSFQVINRQLFNAAQWIAAYDAALLTAYPGVDPGGKGPPYAYHVRNADGAIGGNPPINASLIGAPILPLPSEQGWKDTVITYPGEVTRIAVRWAPTDMPATGAGAPVVGTNYYDDFPNFGFDPTVLVEDPNNPGALNVGYVWHCHIVDHEDNEMMRNYTVGTAQQFIQ
jgi:FtsP/CotA-like multicopper oxidase with cupredoxin domain